MKQKMTALKDVIPNYQKITEKNESEKSAK
jgi:hypothetical protein